MLIEAEEDFGTTNELFHGMNLDSLWIVMREGKLKVGGDGGRGYDGPAGVCLSRSYKVAKGFADSWTDHLYDSFFNYFDLGTPPDLSGAVMEFDRTKIKQEIIPFDDMGGDVEEEERVLSDLPLDGLVAIWVSPDDIRTFLRYAVEAHKKGGSEYDDDFRATIERVLKDPRLRDIRALH